jgi:hypothetical protein
MLAGGNAGDLRQLWIPAGAAGELKGRALHFSKFPKFLKMLENHLKNETRKKQQNSAKTQKTHKEPPQLPGEAGEARICTRTERGLNEDWTRTARGLHEEPIVGSFCAISWQKNMQIVVFSENSRFLWKLTIFMIFCWFLWKLTIFS